MHQETVTNTVVEQVDVLEADLHQQQDEYNGAVIKFDGTPQTMGDIPTRIIGNLQAEYDEKVAEIDRQLNAPWLTRLTRHCLKFWQGFFDEAPLVGIIICVSFIIAAGFVGGMALFSWLFSGVFRIIPGLIFSPTLFIVFPAITMYRETKALREERATLEQSFVGKTEAVQNDPGALMDEVRTHIEGVQSDYREKLVEVKGKFELAYRAPRLEISRELRKLRNDRKELQGFSLDELPERDELLEIVQSEIDVCNRLLRENYPKEKALAEKLAMIDQKIVGFEMSLEVLDEMKEQHEQREQRLAKFSRYKKDETRWSQLMEAKRLRELQEIESTIAALDEEVTGTQFALAEVAGMLPGGNHLRLQEIRTKLLQ